jgi:class 3 adenylate cyclase
MRNQRRIIGSSPLTYTTIGEHVGMAQRRESVAPAGGVMLGESMAQLEENAVVLLTYRPWNLATMAT